MSNSFSLTPTSAPSSSPSDALTTAQQAYLDNADYAESNSADKCRAFMSACRKLLLLLPTEMGTRESHMRMSPDLIQREIDTAQRWLDANAATASGSSSASSSANGGPRVTRASFERFRD